MDESNLDDCSVLSLPLGQNVHNSTVINNGGHTGASMFDMTITDGNPNGNVTIADKDNVKIPLEPFVKIVTPNTEDNNDSKYVSCVGIG